MSRDVGVGQLVDELEQRGDRLPFEIGAFVALEACEGLLQDSVKLEPDDVRVTLEGSVVVAESATSAEPDEAAQSLVSVLARLLVAAGPGVPPYLLQLVKESTTGQTPRDLRDLHDAIEASLIPINRGASRRVLARLVRESDRPPAPEPPVVDPHELDAELDELLRDPVLRTFEPEQPLAVAAPLEEVREEEEEEEEEAVTEQIRVPKGLRAEPVPAPELRSGAEPEPPPKSFPPPVADPEPPPLTAASAAPALRQQAREIVEPVTATIRKWQPKETEAETETVSETVSETAAVAVTASEPAAAPATASEPASAPETAAGTGPGTPSEAVASPGPRESRASAVPESGYDRPSLPQQPPKRRGGWGVWLFAAAIGLGAYGLVATGALDALLQPTATAPAPAPRGLIEVRVTPADAQIFVFVGRGPAIARDLPVDGAHEFVIFDQGLQPSRAQIAADAPWAETESGPLYELAVQARPTDTPSEASALGAAQTSPSGETDSARGAVRVITNPPGAKVYRFVGLGPEAEISVASIHEGQEVLVYHPEHEIRRAVVGPSDWVRGAEAGVHGASLEVQLPPKPRSVAAEPVED